MRSSVAPERVDRSKLVRPPSQKRGRGLQRLDMDYNELDVSLLCHDCGIEAWMFEEGGQLVHEDFYVSNELWDEACPDDRVRRYTVNGFEYGEGRFVVCIGCFEKRLGRELSRGDLTVKPQELFGMPPSQRFRNRWSRSSPKAAY